MLYFKDESGTFFAFDTKEEMEVFGPAGLVQVDNFETNPSAEEALEAMNAEARAFLVSTDWYVIRQIETGQAIPVEIADQRAMAREAVNP